MLQVYQQIGEAGCALAVLALYLALKNLTLLTLIGRDFRRRFALIESGQKPYSEELHNPGNPLIGIIAAVVETHATHSNDLRAEVAYLFHRNFAAPALFNIQSGRRAPSGTSFLQKAGAQKIILYFMAQNSILW